MVTLSNLYSSLREYILITVQFYMAHGQTPKDQNKLIYAKDNYSRVERNDGFTSGAKSPAIEYEGSWR